MGIPERERKRRPTYGIYLCDSGSDDGCLLGGEDDVTMGYHDRYHHQSLSMCALLQHQEKKRTFRKPTCPTGKDQVRECVLFSVSEGDSGYLVRTSVVDEVGEAFPALGVPAKDVYPVQGYASFFSDGEDEGE